MSFEGYYQLLCEDGHYWEEDCVMWEGPEDFDCPDCGKKPVWWHIVDQTNGICHEDECPVSGECLTCDKRIDGYIVLKKKKETNCPTCGAVTHRSYEIPCKKNIGKHQN